MVRKNTSSPTPVSSPARRAKARITIADPRRFRAHRFTLACSLRRLFQTQPHRLHFARIALTEALPGGCKCSLLPGKQRFDFHRRFGELDELPIEPGGIFQRARPGIFVFVHTPMTVGFQIGIAAHLPARHFAETGQRSETLQRGRQAAQIGEQCIGIIRADQFTQLILQTIGKIGRAGEGREKKAYREYGLISSCNRAANSARFSVCRIR